MGLPKYNEMYRDFLTALSDGETHSMAEIRAHIARARALTEEETRVLLPSRSQTVFSNRVSWTGFHLGKAGLVEKPMRGKCRISDAGRQALQSAEPIDNNYLMRFPSYAAFLHGSAPENSAPTEISAVAEADTPQDVMDRAIQQSNSALSDELMQEIMARSPDFFERMVVRLLLKMGYGGPFEDAGIVTSSTNDGGIDGIIKEDKLGFSQIYIQAKRWDVDRVISRPEIHKFCGALQDRGAAKGLFIATCSFSSGAKDSAERQHIVLIDGQMLTRLMIEYDIGVSPIQTYTLKRLDTDFFSEDN